MRDPFHSAAILLLLCILAAGSGPRATSAQVVQGRLVDPQQSAGIGGALISIVGSDGLQLATALTRDSGLFALTAPVAGRYRLKAERIGYATTYSDYFDISAGDTLNTSLEARIQAVSLEGIEVEGDSRCRVRPEEGLAVTRVWNEARKALSTALWTQDRGLYEYRMVGVFRELDADGRRVISEDRTFHQGFAKSPYVSRPAEVLIEEGFARLTNTESIYWAPDAAVLLSDAFLDTHCFRLRTDDADAPGLIGLAFQPVPGRRLPEIGGTLWLDPADSELKWLDFHYLNLRLPAAVRAASLGGKIEFRAMPNGTWIVDSWRIRMPRTEAYRNPFTGGLDVRFAGIAEQSGDVLQAIGNEGAAMAAEVGGQILGIVYDSLQQGLPGARVYIEGSNMEVVTGPGGRFEMSQLQSGIHTVNFSTPYMERLGFRPRPFEVNVVEGAPTPAQVNFAAPTLWRVVDRLCREEERPAQATDDAPGRTDDRPGILTGEVVDADGVPQGGVAVRIMSRAYDVSPGASIALLLRDGMIVTTSQQGVYRACGVPVDTNLVVAVLKPGWGLESGRSEAQLLSDRATWTVDTVRIATDQPFAILDLRVESDPGSP